MKRTAAALTFFLLLALDLTVLPGPRSLRAASAVEDDAAKVLPYARFLAEFSNRRRANVYFENQQSVFHGVQVNWVNVGTGNLTFVRRDLVTVGRLPVMAARIYDSAGGGSADFGVGWKLSATETITLQRGVATLTDDTGSEIRFVATGSSFVLERDFPSDVSELNRLSESRLAARFRTGLKKEFTLIGSAYRLTRVTDRNGNSIRLTYLGESLSKIENTGHIVRFLRNAQGRIIAVTDEQARAVKYRYDKSGRLGASVDAGGNLWSYAYDDGGLLCRASDPDGRQNFKVFYGKDGKVRDVELPSGHISYHYDDAERVTSVTDRRNLMARYWQDADGITVRVVNPLGDESAVGLDTARNVASVKLNGTLIHTMEYDTKHRLLFRRSTTASAEVTARYEYDSATGELQRIKYGDGNKHAFTFDGKGNVLSANEAEESYKYAYSPTGDVTRFADGEMVIRMSHDNDGLIRHIVDGHGEGRAFGYSASGRLAEVRADSGLRAMMKYNALGLRQTLDFSDGRRSRYIYDSAANLRATRSVDSSGITRGEALTIGNDYEVRKVTLNDGGERSFEYDHSDNLIRAEMPSGTYRFEYDGLNRLSAVIQPSGERLHYAYAAGERSLVEQADAHSTISISSRWNSGATFEDGPTVRALRTRVSQYGSVSFANGTFGMAGGSEIVLPGAAIEDALSRLGLLHPAQGYGGSGTHFYAPANRMFLPAEYAFLNCCVCGEGPVPPDLPCGYCPPPDPLPPTISGISPVQGLVGTSVRVTISGSHLGPYAAVSAGSGISITYVSRSLTQVVADFVLANSSSTGGNHAVTVSTAGGISNSKTFFVQVPTFFGSNSANSTDGGCATGAGGQFFTVHYQVLDQNGSPMQLSGVTPQEHVTVNGVPKPGFQSFSTPPSTIIDGKFDDDPVGTCFGPPQAADKYLRLWHSGFPGDARRGHLSDSNNNQSERL
jgi:YD repeat-containing protein